MRNTNNFLKMLYLNSGVQLYALSSEFYAKHDMISDGQAFMALMQLRETNYDLYLKCLADIIFISYDVIELENDISDKDQRSSFVLTYSEEIAINEVLENDKNEKELRKKLIDYLEESGSLIELDQKLANDENLDLLLILLKEHINSSFDSDYDSLCFDILSNTERLDLYQKYIDQQDLLGFFNEAILFAIKEAPLQLLDLLENIFLITNSIEVVKEYHKRIIRILLKDKRNGPFAMYIHELIWAVYKRGINLRDSGIEDATLENFIQTFEQNPNFNKEVALDLITCRHEFDIFDLYFNSAMPDLTSITNTLKDHLPMYTQSQQDVIKLIKKIIPPTNKNE